MATAILKRSASDREHLKEISRIHAGLSFRAVQNLQKALDVPMEKLASVLGMSRATLHRRKIQGKIDKEESEKLVRYQRLLKKAEDVFGGGDSAREWLTTSASRDWECRAVGFRQDGDRRARSRESARPHRVRRLFLMAEVVGWRIVKEKHASTAFSGEGARIFEGRWNSAGVRMVYCSENLALAALEILAHTRPVTMRDKFRAFRVSWDEAIMVIVDLKKLPKGWNSQPPTAASKNIGDEWIKLERSAVLCAAQCACSAGTNFPPQSQALTISRKIKIKDAGNFILDPGLR